MLGTRNLCPYVRFDSPSTCSHASTPKRTGLSPQCWNKLRDSSWPSGPNFLAHNFFFTNSFRSVHVVHSSVSNTVKKKNNHTTNLWSCKSPLFKQLSPSSNKINTCRTSRFSLEDVGQFCVASGALRHE